MRQGRGQQVQRLQSGPVLPPAPGFPGSCVSTSAAILPTLDPRGVILRMELNRPALYLSHDLRNSQLCYLVNPLDNPGRHLLSAPIFQTQKQAQRG